MAATVPIVASASPPRAWSRTADPPPAEKRATEDTPEAEAVKQSMAAAASPAWVWAEATTSPPTENVAEAWLPSATAAPPDIAADAEVPPTADTDRSPPMVKAATAPVPLAAADKP